MSLAAEFESWRAVHKTADDWALAWFLANEFCRRFYSSHGIAPLVIDHDGLGYYGIKIAKIPCKVNGEQPESLGRLTMAGDVENWISGGPGDHGLAAARLCDDGAPTSEIVRKAIRHMKLPRVPEKSHVGCRHKRRGASYELLFEIAALVALRTEYVGIWNAPFNVVERLQELDPKAGQKEHPGAFLFVRPDHEVLVAGDGRVLGKPGGNLWLRYMAGETVDSLAAFIQKALGA